MTPQQEADRPAAARRDRRKRVLVVAPHADDETLGVGGTMTRYAREGDQVFVAVITGHGTERPHPLWPKEAWDVVRGELRQACALMGVADVLFEEVPAVEVADQPVWRLNQLTRGLVERVSPDVLYVPFPLDLHKDHREVFHSFSVHWRPYLKLGQRIQEVYAYEVASETHLNIPYVEQGFLPNTWVDISAELPTKLAALACFKSQLQQHPAPRSLKALEALAVWRGAQIGVEAAEAFVLVRRLVCQDGGT
jgi:LmbE family N-acetylglucosaminyl deacetylase